jgi:raffinose synthase
MLERHLQTFHHREKKRVPSFLDWFGWCTWDAFYTDVTTDGVRSGLLTAVLYFPCGCPSSPALF